jgi:hypothetical protein
MSIKDRLEKIKKAKGQKALVAPRLPNGLPELELNTNSQRAEELDLASRRMRDLTREADEMLKRAKDVTHQVLTDPESVRGRTDEVSTEVETIANRMKDILKEQIAFIETLIKGPASSLGDSIFHTMADVVLSLGPIGHKFELTIVKKMVTHVIHVSDQKRRELAGPLISRANLWYGRSSQDNWKRYYAASDIAISYIMLLGYLKPHSEEFLREVSVDEESGLAGQAKSALRKEL